MPSEEDYRREIDRLRVRLHCAERALRAIGREAFAAPPTVPETGLARAAPPAQTADATDQPYRTLVEHMQEGALTLGPEGVVRYCNPSFATMVRQDRHAVLGQPLERLVVPADRSTVRALIEQARHAAAAAEVTLTAADGARVPVDLAARPFQAEATAGLCLTVTELTQRRRDEALLRAGKLARSILDHATEAFLVCDPLRRITHANPAALRLFGTPLLDQPIRTAIGARLTWGPADSDGPASLDQAIDSALAGRIVGTLEARLAQPAGAPRELLFGAGPVLDARHQVLGCVITLTDITERKQGEERLRLLAAELSHRVKNTIAVIQTIADQTLARSRSMHAFAKAFQGRLRALAAGHRLLLESHWRSASLHTLIEHSLRAAAPAAAGHIDVSGPAIELPPRTAVALGMALHELATNAARHGALSVASGRVEIAWWFDEPVRGGQFHLRWSEHGGPDVQPPARSGFGTELIRRTVEYDLDGIADLAFRAGGLCCEIIFRLETEAMGLARESGRPEAVPTLVAGDGGSGFNVAGTSRP